MPRSERFFIPGITGRARCLLSDGESDDEEAAWLSPCRQRSATSSGLRSAGTHDPTRLRRSSSSRQNCHRRSSSEDSYFIPGITNKGRWVDDAAIDLCPSPAASSVSTFSGHHTSNSKLSQSGLFQWSGECSPRSPRPTALSEEQSLARGSTNENCTSRKTMDLESDSLSGSFPSIKSSYSSESSKTPTKKKPKKLKSSGESKRGDKLRSGQKKNIQKENKKSQRNKELKKEGGHARPQRKPSKKPKRKETES